MLNKDYFEEVYTKVLKLKNLEKDVIYRQNLSQIEGIVKDEKLRTIIDTGT